MSNCVCYCVVLRRVVLALDLSKCALRHMAISELKYSYAASYPLHTQASSLLHSEKEGCRCMPPKRIRAVISSRIIVTHPKRGVYHPD